ncbi:DUF3300 domain-containing protein [Pseudomonas sp. GCM10022188]|uniref:DUF3300 domain-containing protein n=1 Tax=Pseudomonas TaxID=286 RepID=UPI001E57ED37|nr:DUF3300 domain-containing protein [Pseudomonas oryzagri]MCC6074376.1 DUF3300 domain-containing protein [Pseudomonas oryzagri]
MRTDRRFSAVLLAWLALAGGVQQDVRAATEAATAPPAPTSAEAAAGSPATEAVFRPEELDQMMAPLALYPDSLLAQVLMASTYPGDVADAVAWSKANPKASGDAAVRQVANQPWDPSVQSLVAFPAVLVTLGQDPAWVQRVGDAFLAQPNEVMDSVQRLRRQAKAAGNLESNEQQKVSVQSAAQGGATTVVEPSGGTTVVQAPPAEQTIIIESADPQVVYVPSYNPSVVYGTWPYPSYPPTYYPPPPGYYFGSALVAGLGFAAGVAVIDSVWGDCDWGGGDVDIDVNKYNNINSNRKIDASQRKWQHNAANRDGVPYRDRANREQYSQRLAGSEQRDALRGRDPARAAERQQAAQTRGERGDRAAGERGSRAAAERGDRAAGERAQSADRERARQTLGERGIDAPARSNREAQERARVAGREMRDQPQARPRAQAGAQPRQRTQNSAQARQQARQQYSGGQRTRDSAFADARQPSRSKASASRGELSRASASRPKMERSSRQVQRAAPSRGSRSMGGGGARGGRGGGRR